MNKHSRLAIITLLAALAGSAGGLFAQSSERALDDALKTMAGILSGEMARGGTRIAAVIEFGDSADRLGGSAGVLGRYIAWAFPSVLQEAGRGRYSLVDREATARLLAEQEFQLSGMVQDKGIARAGRILACDTLVLGTILELEKEVIGIGAKALSVETGALLSSVMRRVNLTPEVKALVGKDDLDPNASKRLGSAQAEPYALRVIVGGRARKEYSSEGERWILAERGAEYRLELENRTKRRVGVALLIDGVNTAFMRRESPPQAVKWVLEPGSTAVIPGWQVDMGSARAFVFAGREESLAAGMGFGGEIGLITASFYPEELAPKGGAPSEAGTKAGKAFGSEVVRVNIYFEPKPVEVVALHYDYRKGLESRGIRPSE